MSLKSHVLALKAHVATLPFCIVDCDGFNHIPHGLTSVFGANRWLVVAGQSDNSIIPEEINRLRNYIARFLPNLDQQHCEVGKWAGTTVQAMHCDQIEPGRVPLPTIIDHAHQSPPLQNLLSVYPGRATLWVRLAEQARQFVLDRLEVKTTRTAKPPWADDERSH